MELADKTGAKKYDDYVLKNMNFVFNEGNLDFFKKQYDQAMKNEGWYGVRKLSWHMIFRGKRLDDNGPMGASLIDLQMKHPNNSFLNYINETAEHLNYGEPRLADGTIARICLMKIPSGLMMLSCYLFPARMAKMTGDMSYINDAANQVIKYHKYLWCPENGFSIIAIIRIIKSMEWRIGRGPMDGFLWRQPICWPECRKITPCVMM